MEKKHGKLKTVIFVPTIFVALLWLILLFEMISGYKLNFLGVIPGQIEGLIGVLFSPLIHAGPEHLMSNTSPLLVLGAACFYFFPQVAWRVIIMIYILSGLGVWIFEGIFSDAGEVAVHIGASGIVYGLAFFTFFGGVFSKDKHMLALSLLVVFIYGGMVWGLLPIQEKVSWQSHLFGALTGLVCAIIFRKKAPKKKEHDWGESLEDRVVRPGKNSSYRIRSYDDDEYN
jgi:membrane associated rhomboid family serine protease